MNWNLLPILPNSAQNPGRIVLAVSNTVAQTVYRLDSLGRLYRFDGVRLRRAQQMMPAASLVGTQGWYDLVARWSPAPTTGSMSAGRS